MPGGFRGLALATQAESIDCIHTGILTSALAHIRADSDSLPGQATEVLKTDIGFAALPSPPEPAGSTESGRGGIEGIMRLTLIMAYYLNPVMLAKQYEIIAAYPEAIKQQLQYIIVDDGSPHSPAVNVPRPPGIPALKIFRINVDVRWNMDAARNIGVKEAHTEWLLLTDMDHLVPVETINAVMAHEFDPHRVYRFARLSAPDLLPYHVHPNSWLMTRTVYGRVGGYDERLAGLYGTDEDFRDRITQITAISDLPWPLIRVPCDVIPDAATTTYTRTVAYDRSRIDELRSGRDAKRERPITGQFEYERVL